MLVKNKFRDKELKGEYAMRQKTQAAIDKTTKNIEERATDPRMIETLLKITKDLMETMGWTAEQSLEAIGVTEDDRAKMVSRL